MIDDTYEQRRDRAAEAYVHQQAVSGENLTGRLYVFARKDFKAGYDQGREQGRAEMQAEWQREHTAKVDLDHKCDRLERELAEARLEIDTRAKPTVANLRKEVERLTAEMMEWRHEAQLRADAFGKNCAEVTRLKAERDRLAKALARAKDGLRESSVDGAADELLAEIERLERGE